MNKQPVDILRLVAAVLCFYFGYCGIEDHKNCPPAPIQPSPLVPAPLPPDPVKPKPKPNPGPWGSSMAPVGAWVGGPKYQDGTEVTCDLPHDTWLKNVGGRDGLGLCVFTSLAHSARWQNERRLEDFQDKMRSEMGGGWPDKVDEMIRKYAPGVQYLQYEGNDTKILDLAIKTGRMPSVTYGYSERYGGPVPHMVNLLHLDERLACVLDNNFVKPNELEWMEREEFLKRWKMGGGGWAVVLLNPTPTPVPRSR